MSVAWEWNLDGYKPFGGFEQSSELGSLGMKIFIKIDRELTEEDKKTAWEIRDLFESRVHKETLRLDPKTSDRALIERAEIINLFPSPIFVEEIPNGYCSRYCCAFKPWFVVTTHKGRIKIGWRKRVIHLEWTDSVIKGRAKDIFPKEEAWPGYETTQYDKVIHAHGYEPAAAYIKRLLEAE
jgi:hypothetical protein